jgi:hypothetical protein
VETHRGAYCKLFVLRKHLQWIGLSGIEDGLGFELGVDGTVSFHVPVAEHFQVVVCADVADVVVEFANFGDEVHPGFIGGVLLLPLLGERIAHVGVVEGVGAEGEGAFVQDHLGEGGEKLLGQNHGDIL